MWSSVYVHPFSIVPLLQTLDEYSSPISLKIVNSLKSNHIIFLMLLTNARHVLLSVHIVLHNSVNND